MKNNTCKNCLCKKPKPTNEEFISENPGRDVQRVGTARFLNQNPLKIHQPVWAVTGSLGDSQCYLGVNKKVDQIQKTLADTINQQTLPIRLIAPAFTIGVSDGQLNGTQEMRYSLIGREVTHDSLSLHLNANKVTGCISVVACDKPPVGTLAALLESNTPSIIFSDGSIRPGTDPKTNQPIDIVTGFQVAADPDQEKKNRIALNACCGQGSCGGMFTYNTMQSFIAVLGMEPLYMVSPASDDKKRLEKFPQELVSYLLNLTQKQIKPQDIVTPASLKNALTVAIAMGGSTNVILHSVEIARAAGIDLWQEVITQEEFNTLSQKIPVLVNGRPFGKYSMVDIEEKGGLPVIVKELLDAGLLDGSCLTCTGETLSEQIKRLNPSSPDGEVLFSIKKPYKKTGGLRLLSGNLSPNGGAVIKIAGVEKTLTNNTFTGKAKTFDSEQELLTTLSLTPDIFQDNDMIVIRYEGPRGAPGMPEMLDPTSRITALCRQKNITIGLMTDARFSGGSVGVVIGHVGPEAYLGGPIALIQNNDTIIVDLNKCTIDCQELTNPKTLNKRQKLWQEKTQTNNGIHPSSRPITNRLLKRMRALARPALLGGGIE